MGEAVQCPTLLLNGYGGHRIEGIGDKHVPWIHNVRNTDMVIGIDDNDAVRMIRLFNEPAGRDYLVMQGVPEKTVNNLDLLGISSIGNVIGAIKFAKYYELTERDIVFTVFTDSMELYGSRLKELEEKFGKYTKEDAARDYERLQTIGIDYILEPDYYEKRRIHNLKYYTWIEQQGKELSELNDQWYRWKEYWARIHSQVDEIDSLIEDFNRKVGLISVSYTHLTLPTTERV